VTHYSGQAYPVTFTTVAAFGGGFERALNRHASFRLEGTGSSWPVPAAEQPFAHPIQTYATVYTD